MLRSCSVLPVNAVSANLQWQSSSSFQMKQYLRIQHGIPSKQRNCFYQYSCLTEGLVYMYSCLQTSHQPAQKVPTSSDPSRVVQTSFDRSRQIPYNERSLSCNLSKLIFLSLNLPKDQHHSLQGQDQAVQIFNTSELAIKTFPSLQNQHFQSFAIMQWGDTPSNSPVKGAAKLLPPFPDKIIPGLYISK